MILPAGAAFAQPEHEITIDFMNVLIHNNHSGTDAEMEFFGIVGGPGTAGCNIEQFLYCPPVRNGCILDEFNACSLSYMRSYLTPGSGLDDAGDDTYHFTVPEKTVRLIVRDDGSFTIGSVAYNRVWAGLESGEPIGSSSQRGVLVGSQSIVCSSENNFCTGNGQAHWDLGDTPSGKNYHLRFNVYETYPKDHICYCRNGTIVG